MAEDDTTKTGLIKVDGHCLFVWRELGEPGERYFERRADHCQACLSKLGDLLGQPPRFLEPPSTDV